MSEIRVSEIKRRSVVKTLIWRVIGIIWTWIGAYLILSFAPDQYRAAAWAATLIVLYHHSTRMIMYYFYERIWAAVKWGKVREGEEYALAMSSRAKLIWTLATVAVVVLIFGLLILVSSMMAKAK